MKILIIILTFLTLLFSFEVHADTDMSRGYLQRADGIKTVNGDLAVLGNVDVTGNVKITGIDGSVVSPITIVTEDANSKGLTISKFNNNAAKVASLTIKKAEGTEASPVAVYASNEGGGMYTLFYDGVEDDIVSRIVTDMAEAGGFTGTHKAGYSNSAFLVDSAGQDLTGLGTDGARVGNYIYNTTDGSKCIITAVQDQDATNDRVNCTLTGGTDNDWDTADAYLVGEHMAGSIWIETTGTGGDATDKNYSFQIDQDGHVVLFGSNPGSKRGQNGKDSLIIYNTSSVMGSLAKADSVAMWSYDYAPGQSKFYFMTEEDNDTVSIGGGDIEAQGHLALGTGTINSAIGINSIHSITADGSVKGILNQITRTGSTDTDNDTTGFQNSILIEGNNYAANSDAIALNNIIQSSSAVASGDTLMDMYINRNTVLLAAGGIIAKDIYGGWYNLGNEFSGTTIVTATNVYNTYIADPTVDTFTVTNLIGHYLEDLTKGTNQYGIVLVDDADGIYLNGTATPTLKLHGDGTNGAITVNAGLDVVGIPTGSTANGALGGGEAVVGAVCMSDSNEIYIDTDGSCAD